MGVTEKLSPWLIFLLLVSSFTEKVWAASNHLAYKYFNYNDSDQNSIWENLLLYSLDLNLDTSVSLRYGVDAVSSPSFATVSGASAAKSASVQNYAAVTGASAAKGTGSGEEHEGSGNDGSNANLKYRNFGGLSVSHHYTETLQGDTSLDISSKSDFYSSTVGQSLNFPGWGPAETLGVGIYYTANKIHPSISTTNPVLLPPKSTMQSTQMDYLLSWEHILDTKSKIKFLVETFNANGYLSTGYQQVPINNGTLSGVALEQLPDKRNGTALTVIYSRWLYEKAAAHFRVRGYDDSFGISAFSGDLKYRFYANELTIIELGYRYYQQSAAKFWGDSFSTIPTGYFTNHPSLGKFFANQVDLGIRYEINPENLNILDLYGNVNANYSNYHRSDGLTFNTFSLGFETEF